VANQTAGGDDASFCMSSEYMALFDLQNDARPTGQPQLDYEPHTFKLHRDELGAPLLAAGVSPPPQHVSIPLHALNVPQVSEAGRGGRPATAPASSTSVPSHRPLTCHRQRPQGGHQLAGAAHGPERLTWPQESLQRMVFLGTNGRRLANLDSREFG